MKLKWGVAGQNSRDEKFQNLQVGSDLSALNACTWWHEWGRTEEYLPFGPWWLLMFLVLPHCQILPFWPQTITSKKEWSALGMTPLGPHFSLNYCSQLSAACLLARVDGDWSFHGFQKGSRRLRQLQLPSTPEIQKFWVCNQQSRNYQSVIHATLNIVSSADTDTLRLI